MLDSVTQKFYYYLQLQGYELVINLLLCLFEDVSLTGDVIFKLASEFYQRNESYDNKGTDAGQDF